MCGIVGIVDFQNSVSVGDVISLRDTLTHRGPDSAGVYINLKENVGLGHRRLAVIDLSDLGHQPMCNEDATIWVVFNGEIYNFRLIREQLLSCGHVFRSNSDTEVIVHAYEEWGSTCVKRFVGMFAFAIYDGRNNTDRLILARDRLGVKPLFYVQQDRRLIFSSEVHPLYRYVVPSMGNIDRGVLDYYLAYGYTPPDKCFICGIDKLPPAHVFTFSEEGMSSHCYWEITFRPSHEARVEDYLDDLEIKFQLAVKRRLESDVPLGCFLSGGIDSGLVTAFASRVSTCPVKTFSASFEGATTDQDERHLAKRVAELYGTDHQELLVTTADHDQLPKILWHYGEPFSDSSCLATFQISKTARQYITVALSGDGGDEAFAGYMGVHRAHLAEKIRTCLPYSGQRILADVTGRIPGRQADRLHRWIIHYVGQTVREQYNLLALWHTELRSELYHRDWLHGCEFPMAPKWVNRVQSKTTGLSDAEIHLYTDLHLRLPGDYMVKVDIASSMVGLEVRSPFYDHELVEYAAQIPVSCKLLNYQQKGLLRKMAQRHLPAEIVTQPKRGFAPPLSRWLRTDWASLMHALLNNGLAQRKGLFSASVISRMILEHIQGKTDHSSRLWNLMCLELWFQLFLDHQ